MNKLLAVVLAMMMASVIAQDANALTCADLDGAEVWSQESSPQYLGFFGSEFALDSIMNTYGTYGSSVGIYSVRNSVGTYGSSVGPYSANNSIATYPPKIYKYGDFVAYLTTNTLQTPGISLGEIDISCTFYSSMPAPNTQPVLPNPPSQVNASDGTYTDKIEVTWSTVSNAAAYNVYYSETVDSPKSHLGQYPGPSVNVTGVAPGDVWYFWVYSVNTVGESATGTYDTGYIQSVTVPDAPTLNSVESGDGKAVLRFTANGNGGSAITGYTGKCGASTQSGSSSPITVSGLSNGTTYSCSVVATNAIGDSASSATLSVTPNAGCIEKTPFRVAFPKCRDDFEPVFTYSPTTGDSLLASGGSACLNFLILNPVVDNQWQGVNIYPDGTYTGDFEVDNFSIDDQGRASFDACIDERSPAIFIYGIYGGVTGVRMALGVREQCGDEICIDITGRKQYTEAWKGWGSKGVESGSEYTRVYVEEKVKEKISAGNYFHEDGTPASPDEITITNTDVGVLLGISGVTFAEPMNTGHLAGMDTQNVKIVEGTIYDYTREGEEAISCFPHSSELKVNGDSILGNPDHCAYNLQNYPNKQVFEQERYGHSTLGVIKKVGFTPFTSVQTSVEGSTCSVSIEHNSNHDDTYTEFWQTGELKLKAEGNIASFTGACDDVEALAYVQDHKGNPVKLYKQTIPSP